MEADRIKWNDRFGSSETYLGELPSPFLAREIERIQRLSPGRLCLDIACGEGRNSIFLAQHGFRVTGLDISDVGIERGREWARAAGLTVDFQRVDLDDYRIAGRYDLIINFNFLLRELISQEVDALTPGGLLLFDSILESPKLLETHQPDYFLRHGELRQLFERFPGEILFEEEVRQGEFPTARLFYRNTE
jgi:SAM-dependent methyltransferase